MGFDYKSMRWKRKRRHILKLDGYMDVVAKRYGKAREATVVRHIYSAEKYPEYAYCDWNLISVSEATHNKIENRQTRELTPMGKELMRRTQPGIDWRKAKPPTLACGSQPSEGPVGGDSSNSGENFQKGGKEWE